MNDNRRHFLKKMSVAGAAALTIPGILTAAEKSNGGIADGIIPKTILFQGDSITDGGRSFDHDWNHVYGQDYGYLITARLNYDYPANDYQFFNRGISGNKLKDLGARWQKDTIDIKPDLLSILVGVNDVYGVVVQGSNATAEDFEQSYDALLAQTVQALPGVKLVLCEPFILALGMVNKDPARWTAELQKRQPIIKQLAIKYNAVYVPLQEAFDNALLKAPAEHWIWDGVHPMPAGHELIAREWLKAVKKHYKIW